VGLGRREFAVAAGMMTVIHLVAGWPRPRLAVVVSGTYGCAAGANGGRVADGTAGDGDVCGGVPALGLEVVADGPPAPGAAKQLIEPMVFGPYCT